MKVLKIFIIACSIGIGLASCKRSCPDTTANQAVAPAATVVNDGTAADVNKAIDTAALVGAADMNNGSRESAKKEAATPAKKHTPGVTHRNVNNNPSAHGNGPDLEASKKREGNFTNASGRYESTNK